MPWTRRSSATRNLVWDGKHRSEHWYRDNQVYFITARCRGQTHAFESEQAKAVFWDRLSYWSSNYGFDLWIVSLLSNHYHLIGYLETGENLGPMMQRIHGSIAKLVNDLLEVRLTPFWVDGGHKDYFDGCLRDEKQLRRSYRYTLTQSVRHRICSDYRAYLHTRVFLDIETSAKRAIERNALLTGVRYKRYGQ